MTHNEEIEKVVRKIHNIFEGFHDGTIETADEAIEISSIMISNLMGNYANSRIQEFVREVKPFEEFLEDTCFEANPMVLDDDMPDFFDDWLGSQEVEDMLRHGENYQKEVLALSQKYISKDNQNEV